jgi:hypothetical protein
MKTYFIRLLLAVLGVFLMACVLSHSASAQTIISFDSSPDNTLVVRIQNPFSLNQLHKFIFVFDSASITYELDESGEFAFVTSNQSGGRTADINHVVSRDQSLQTSEENKRPSTDLNAIQGEEETEEALKVEDWMLNPEKWMN